MTRKFTNQRGVSLIELMISLTIGVILILATMVTYLGSATASRMAEAQGRMNEDAYAALNLLSQQLRMAGNNPVQPNRPVQSPTNPVYDTTDYFLRGCNHTFSNVTSATSLSALTCSTASGTDTHSISVNYEADKYNTVALSSGQPTDCLGNGVTATSSTGTTVSGTSTVTSTVTYYVAENRFYIGTSTAVVNPSLYCKGNGGAAQPLVENVEDLKLSYGTIPATGTSTAVVGYVDAATLLTQTDLAALPDDPTRWSRVMTVRICILMRSESPVVDTIASAAYLDCSNNLITNPPDLRLRRAYSTTVVLRNRVNIN